MKQFDLTHVEAVLIVITRCVFSLQWLSSTLYYRCSWWSRWLSIDVLFEVVVLCCHRLSQFSSCFALVSFVARPGCAQLSCVFCDWMFNNQIFFGIYVHDLMTDQAMHVCRLFGVSSEKSVAEIEDIEFSVVFPMECACVFVMKNRSSELYQCMFCQFNVISECLWSVYSPHHLLLFRCCFAVSAYAWLGKMGALSWYQHRRGSQFFHSTSALHFYSHGKV